MKLDTRVCERARLSRDARFDGRFFVGVVTTGIFCRPICPAPPPKARNVRFFPSAAAASSAGLRPCLRCRPETAPGTPAWNGTSATVARALRQIEAGALDEGSVDEMARRLGVGTRHLGRLFQKHLGASPVAVAQTRRLLFAKKLLNETGLGMADVAFAAGFGSVRRFNHLVRKTYDRMPSDLRRLAGRNEAPSSTAPLTLRLPFRPPFEWKALIAFLAPRAIPGVEEVAEGAYRRNIRFGDRVGRLEIRPARSHDELILAVDFPDSKALLPIAARVRRLFDLDSDPAEISSRLESDRLLGSLVSLRPGLRVPGAWDGFELAIRAILGQQVTVRGATTLSGRVVEEYGCKVPGGFVFPGARKLARARFTRVGIPKTRAAAIRKLAGACASGELRLEPGVDPIETTVILMSLPGVGDWTAQYIAMRALGEPDAFPSSDLGLLKAAGQLMDPAGDAVRPAELRNLAEKWRPWRAYGAMHLWKSLS